MPAHHPEPAQPQDIFAALDRTPYGSRLRDTASRRSMVYEAMANSADPMTRELGEQLASGRVKPLELLSRAEYREFFSRGLSAGDRLNVQEMAATAMSLAANDRLAGDVERDTALYTRNAGERDERRDDSEPGNGAPGRPGDR